MTLFRAVAGVFVIMAIVVGRAPAAWSEEQPRWQDTAELSFVQTGGNTDVTTIAAKNLLQYRLSDNWAMQWKAAALHAESDGEKTAERYETDLRTDYKGGERIYYYGLAGWVQDTFAGLDQRIYGGPGIGYRFLIGPRHQLVGELGAYYAREKYTDGSADDLMEGRAYGKYQFKFSETVQFSQDLEYLHNFKDSAAYKLISVSALQSKLNEWLAVRVAYELRYDNRPTPADLKNSDSLLTVSLVLNL
ncbi:DUF481 domain-containing protein [Desulfatitalea alkaliphila]|uniref:DUF481 domain-containing protein n=1 Tax=Desulfatitalea alkaliphila TaxID=2929485 RepID=A0AA41R617_9BACT|nr:DUF481 domain-containing protein [Desulfatitalea alkaliphila]MCJ8501536.1 DUF481 domain-containing protein [Desulfatitalea alkaliphila]